MRKGALVLLPFPFTDLSGSKVRPALILAVPERGSDCIVSFITSRKEASSRYGVVVTPTDENGIKTPSTIRLDKIATLQKDLVLGEIGTLPQKTMLVVDGMLQKLFSI
jgi:mRNA interferase MazF